jgi:hypothetical protein
MQTQVMRALHLAEVHYIAIHFAAPVAMVAVF